MARQARGVKYRKDGRMEKRITINGVRYSVFGHSMKELEKKELALRQSIAEGLRVTGQNITLDRYFEDWIEAKRGTVKETTLRNEKLLYATVSKTCIDKAGTTFGSLKVREVEGTDVRALQKALQEGHATRTVNDMISLVKGVFRSAMVYDRIITFNPCSSVRKLKRTEPQLRDTKHRALTRTETTLFLSAAADSYYRNLYLFLLNTGCRVGEAGALQIRDIGKKSIHVARTLTRTENGGWTIGEDTKTKAGERLIPITAEAAQAIEQQKALNRLVFDEKQGMTNVIFRSTKGALLRSAPINEDIKRICGKAGIEPFTVHAFRDTFCTRCVESGMPPKTLQTIMGHADIKMTFELYAHCEEDTAAEALKAVNFM